MKLAIITGLLALISSLVYAKDISHDNNSSLKSEFTTKTSVLIAESKDVSSIKSEFQKEDANESAIQVSDPKKIKPKQQVTKQTTLNNSVVLPQQMTQEPNIIIVSSPYEIQKFASTHTFITQQEYTVPLRRDVILSLAKKYTANNVLTQKVGNRYRFYYFQ